MKSLRLLVMWSVAVAGLGFTGLVWSACLDSGVQVQILGSGGPGPSTGRASAGYIVWVDGVGRIMVDAGSGTKDQFHTAGASLDDIGLLALSHFHPDHSSELPAILWPAGSEARLSGPTGSEGFPSVTEFLERMFAENGVFPVFGDRVDFDVLTVDTASRDVVDVWEDGEIRVRGIGVPHANVPTIGYRVDVGESSIAFSSDQNGSDMSYIDFIQDVDVLVIHMNVGENVSGFGAQLHAKPSVWGEMAEHGNAGRVLVSHIGAQTTDALQAQLDVLSDNYAGPVTVGEDLLCVEVE
ncbi:MAG: MBL fold metallo-hydrolase [Gammaproteobacteria bacterium]